MLDIPPLETKLRAHSGNWSCFEIAPVDAAYSRELANALRRVLLASLPGAAVTSMRIDGVQHEFQTITDVLEDVTDIVQNFKKLRLRCYSDRPALMHLDVLGAGKVTARQLTVPSTVEIVNPDLHLATLDNEKADLRMEITVGTGRGFVSCEQHADRRQEKPAIGVILIDSIFSPVCHVNFAIEPVLIERRQKLDKILLEITTDGTIGPTEALRESADLLRRQLLVFAMYWPPPDTQKPTIPLPATCLFHPPSTTYRLRM